MKNPKIIVIGVLILLFVWHIIMAANSKTKVSGILQTKPEAGYVWSDAANTDTRFFWQNSAVKWQAGEEHPEFKVESAENEGSWIPQAGYKFVDEAKGLNTVWQAGLKHPDYMAWSDKNEGDWVPVTGYKFIYEGGTFKDCVWDANKNYDNLKISTGPEAGKYAPYPGYSFVSPGKNLDVVWTPGLVNTDNHRLIAGAREGVWVSNYRPYSHSNNTDKWVAFGLGYWVGRHFY